MNVYKTTFTRLTDFNGVSSIKEFWTVYLTISIGFGFLSALCRFFLGVREPLTSIFYVTSFALTVALGFRRMNDAGFNKWLFLIPLVNLILALFPSKKE